MEQIITQFLANAPFAALLFLMLQRVYNDAKAERAAGLALTKELIDTQQVFRTTIEKMASELSALRPDLIKAISDRVTIEKMAVELIALRTELVEVIRSGIPPK